jgi:hypothetical protein
MFALGCHAKAGDMIVIPQGMLHCPVSKNGATVLLVDQEGWKKPEIKKTATRVVWRQLLTL